MQAARKSWVEKLQGHFKQASVAQTEPASVASLGNVVEASFPRPVPARERTQPEMDEAREAVTRLANALEAAERRAEGAEEQLQTITEFTSAHLDDCRARTKASEGILAEINEAIEANARVASEQLSTAEVRAAAAEE